MYSISVNKKYKEEKKRKKERIKKQADIEKNRKKSQLSLSKVVEKSKEKRKGAISTHKKKKISKTDRQKSIIELDRIYSIYIRLTYAEPVTGLCYCITCYSRWLWNDLQCWHFIDRKNMKYRRDHKNTYPQCKNCNEILSWNIDNYRYVLWKIHWPMTIEKMECDIDDPIFNKVSTAEIIAKIDYYKKRVDEITIQKQLFLSQFF